jgi:hypothetical protein
MPLPNLAAAQLPGAAPTTSKILAAAQSSRTSLTTRSPVLHSPPLHMSALPQRLLSWTGGLPPDQLIPNDVPSLYPGIVDIGVRGQQQIRGLGGSAVIKKKFEVSATRPRLASSPSASQMPAAQHAAVAAPPSTGISPQTLPSKKRRRSPEPPQEDTTASMARKMRNEAPPTAPTPNIAVWDPACNQLSDPGYLADKSKDSR